MEADRVTRRPLRGVMIGAGNVASALAPALEAAGVVEFVQVMSRTQAHAAGLAAVLRRAEPVSDAAEVSSDADVYILSVKDDAVPAVVAQMPRNGALWMHTSGSVPMEALAPLTDRYGVLYPLQTFTKGKRVDMAGVPVFTEGSTPATEEAIAAMARAVSDKVSHADGAGRKRIHAAAVFACNFVNHMYAVADDVLRAGGMGLEVLYPLMAETLHKATTIAPRDGQTGPAVRGDESVMQGHRELLDASQAELYAMMSNRIKEYYRNEQDKL